jgi:hypothetical protein
MDYFLDKKNHREINQLPGSPWGGILYDVRLTVPLTADMVARLDAARGPDESRVALIRFAIDQELQRREQD